MNSIEIIIALFLFFAVGLLLGYVEGTSQGWFECAQFYRHEIMAQLKRSKR